MADVPKTGKPYTELPEVTDFDDNDEVFLINDGYGERGKVGTFIDTVAYRGGSDHSIADSFDEDRSYTAGDICIYENNLYVFTADKSAGEWDEEVVEITTLDEQIQREAQARDNADDKLEEKIKSNTDLIDSLLATDTSEQVSIEGISAGSYDSRIFNASKSGYTLLGILGWYSNMRLATIFRIQINYQSEGNIRIGVRNDGTSEFSSDSYITFTLLYQKQ